MIAVALLLAAAPAPAAAAPRALTLAEAEALALRTDPSVERSRIEVERARLATLTANLERIHASVDASVQELYAGTSTVFFAEEPAWKSGILGLSNVQASIDAPLFSGFRVESDIARAEDLEKAAGYDLAAARRSAALAVADAYWSARRLALLEQAQAASEERLAESERVVEARVSSGLAAGLDKNRAAARRAQHDVDKAGLAAQRREASERLATLLGIDEPVTLVDDPPVAEASVPDLDHLLSAALDARPELRAAELRGAAVDEEKRAAESGYWPQVGAGVLAQIGNNPLIAGAGSHAVGGGAVPFFGSAADVQAGVTVSVNLFDTGATTNAVQDAAHRRRLADADLRAQRRQVESDVRLSRARLVSLRSQREALEKARAIEADNVEILKHAYERGEVLVTELLDEELRLADAERQIVDVDAQLAIAKIELDSATGSFEVSP